MHNEERMGVKYVHQDDPRENDTDLVSKLGVRTNGDLFELLKMSCGVWNLSVLIHMIMRYVGHSWRSTEFSW